MSLFKKILVPIDGSDTADKAMRMALDMARESLASVRFLHVIEHAPEPRAGADGAGGVIAPQSKLQPTHTRSAKRRMKRSHQASCSSVTHSLGWCAWAMWPGPHTMVGTPAW